TPPPRDESSDSDSEPEAEEADDEPEAEDADDELEVKEAGVEPEAEGADETLGKVVERLKALESEENATLRKKLAENEVLLDLTHPYHLLDYDEEEDPKMDIEEEEPEEDLIEEPEPLNGHGDQFDAHPNPQPGNMNG
nr:hypothetical protein [Tanacetum cinerariifolium]